MKRLIEGGFDAAILGLDTAKTEVLGICLGMQLLTEGSEEGSLPGLGLIPGKIKKFTTTFTKGNPIPHMGWNKLEQIYNDYLFEGVSEGNRFYFVHSFYFPLSSMEYVTSITSYEEQFAASIRKGNVAGVQFHPEKSHLYGKQILRNFIQHD
jgi:glutamine amidotransferase